MRFLFILSFCHNLKMYKRRFRSSKPFKAGYAHFGPKAKAATKIKTWFKKYSNKYKQNQANRFAFWRPGGGYSKHLASKYRRRF